MRDGSAWRFQAKFEGVCERCDDTIDFGQWIQKAEEGGYEHCVCPYDVTEQAAQPKEPTTYTEYVMGADGIMVEVERTLE